MRSKKCKACQQVMDLSRFDMRPANLPKGRSVSMFRPHDFCRQCVSAYHRRNTPPCMRVMFSAPQP